MYCIIKVRNLPQNRVRRVLPFHQQCFDPKLLTNINGIGLNMRLKWVTLSLHLFLAVRVALVDIELDILDELVHSSLVV